MYLLSLNVNAQAKKYENFSRIFLDFCDLTGLSKLRDLLDTVRDGIKIGERERDGEEYNNIEKRVNVTCRAFLIGYTEAVSDLKFIVANITAVLLFSNAAAFLFLKSLCLINNISS